MQDKHLYEYAVIRIVPKIEREEFINVGLIMFCKRPKFIKARYHVDEEKLRLFTSDIDKESLCTNLHVFDKICSGAKDGGPIASLDIPERFRWLTAIRSASIQTSRPHPGFSNDLEQTFERLFSRISLIDNKHLRITIKKKTDRPNNPSFLIELIDIILILLSPHP